MVGTWLGRVSGQCNDQQSPAGKASACSGLNWEASAPPSEIGAALSMGL